MSRLVVVLLVLLVAPLLGSTCEFRASTGKIEHPAPHDGQDGSGVKVVVTTGARMLAADPTSDAAEAVRAALSASVLAEDPALEQSPEAIGGAGQGAAPMPPPSAGFRVASASLRPVTGSITGAIPEPGAARLFALGLALAVGTVAARARRRPSPSRARVGPFPAAGNRC